MSSPTPHRITHDQCSVDALVLETGDQLAKVDAPQPLHHTTGRPLQHLLRPLPNGRGPQEVTPEMVHPVV